MAVGLLGPLSTPTVAEPVGEGYSTGREDATHLGKYLNKFRFGSLASLTTKLIQKKLKKPLGFMINMEGLLIG